MSWKSSVDLHIKHISVQTSTAQAPVATEVNSSALPLDSQSVVPRPGASPSTGSLSEMQIFRPHPAQAETQDAAR